MKVEGPQPILAVLGAINVDLVVSGAPLPHPGETVTGGTFAEHHGGKGGNQAVAAARALDHGTIAMLGSVGDDQLGASALQALRIEHVQTDHVLISRDTATGVALIAVGHDGENQISVAPGANLALTPDHLVDAIEALQPHLLLASLEVAEPAIRAAIGWAHGHSVPVVLNPAPFQPWVREVVQMVTFVTPNEGEFAALGDVPSGVMVIETRGARGARIHTSEGVIDVPTMAVDAVDTTGAGDCFNGVLAAGLVRDLPLRDAVSQAAVAAALSVRIAGAREGMPTLDDIQDAFA